MTVARAPYHETLLAFAELEEMERIDALLVRDRDLTRAFDINAAMWGAEALEKARMAHERRLQAAPQDPAERGPTVRDLTPAERMAAARALFAEYGPSKYPIPGKA